MADKQIQIEKVPRQHVQIDVVGTSPFVSHRKSEETKEVLRIKKMHKGKKQRTAWDPEKEADAGLYKLENGDPALPATAFKNAIVAASDKDLGLPMTRTRQSVFVIAEEIYHGTPVIPFRYEAMEIVEEIVRVARDAADLRARYFFHGWETTLHLTFDSQVLSLDAVVNLVDRAGFKVGVGDGRPEKKGGLERGRFEVSAVRAEGK